MKKRQDQIRSTAVQGDGDKDSLRGGKAFYR